MHLVPFGEYMPLRAIMPAAINNLVSSDLKAGREPGLFRLSNAPATAAPLVCFEDTLGDLTRRTCLAGAQIMVNLTNDGWFQKTAGAEQHLANAVFRAVENRRPLVRSTNTGLTGLVDPMGRWQRVDRAVHGKGRDRQNRRPRRLRAHLLHAARRLDRVALQRDRRPLARPCGCSRRWRVRASQGLRSTVPVPQ